VQNNVKSVVQTNPACGLIQKKRPMRTDGHQPAKSFDRDSEASRHMPAKDPLCHVPILTPPAPIQADNRQTPTEERVYTHVSITSRHTSEVHYVDV
jgi:hypothetical protein